MEPSTLGTVVEIDRQVLAWSLVALAVILLLALLLWGRRRRALVRRVMYAAEQLEDSPPALMHGTLWANLDRLDRAIETALLSGQDATSAWQRLARVLDEMPQGVVFCDESGEVVFRNSAAAGFASARHGEALVEAAIEELLASTMDGRTDSRTVELFGPPRRSLELAATPLEDEEGRIGGLVLVEDVSERRWLEEIRRDFVANISHELKTPVGALGLLAETLRAEEDPEVARRLAERVFNEAHRVGRIIDDLLELSQIEVEETPVREPVPVHAVVMDAVDRVRPVAEQRDIAVNADHPGATLTVPGDRRQLVSAVANLLDNAVKYSDSGTSVELRVNVTPGNRVQIEVQDHGIGIPARDLERIFERFYRVDRARSRATGGTGLGLAIVRHVAHNHHGEVMVRSREGEGSTFTLVLPAEAGEREGE